MGWRGGQVQTRHGRLADDALQALQHRRQGHRPQLLRQLEMEFFQRLAAQGRCSAQRLQLGAAQAGAIHRAAQRFGRIHIQGRIIQAQLGAGRLQQGTQRPIAVRLRRSSISALSALSGITGITGMTRRSHAFPRPFQRQRLPPLQRRIRQLGVGAEQQTPSAGRLL